MKTFKILHIEEDPDANFLLEEYLRRIRHIKVDWAPNRAIATGFLTTPYNLIICGGLVCDWEGRLSDILALKHSVPIIIYSDLDRHLFYLVESDISRIFGKTPEGQYSM